MTADVQCRACEAWVEALAGECPICTLEICPRCLAQGCCIVCEIPFREQETGRPWTLQEMIDDRTAVAEGQTDHGPVDG